MVDLGRKIKEAVGAVDNLSKFEKFSKLKASYVEYEKFTNTKSSLIQICGRVTSAITAFTG